MIRSLEAHALTKCTGDRRVLAPACYRPGYLGYPASLVLHHSILIN